MCISLALIRDDNAYRRMARVTAYVGILRTTLLKGHLQGLRVKFQLINHQLMKNSQMKRKPKINKLRTKRILFHYFY